MFKWFWLILFLETVFGFMIYEGFYILFKLSFYCGVSFKAGNVFLMFFSVISVKLQKFTFLVWAIKLFETLFIIS